MSGKLTRRDASSRHQVTWPKIGTYDGFELVRSVSVSIADDYLIPGKHDRLSPVDQFQSAVIAEFVDASQDEIACDWLQRSGDQRAHMRGRDPASGKRTLGFLHAPALNSTNRHDTHPNASFFIKVLLSYISGLLLASVHFFVALIIR